MLAVGADDGVCAEDVTGTATIAAVLTDRLTAKTAAVRWDNRGHLSDARVTFLPLRAALSRAGRTWLASLKEGVAQPPSSPNGSVPVKGATKLYEPSLYVLRGNHTSGRGVRQGT